MPKKSQTYLCLPCTSCTLYHRELQGNYIVKKSHPKILNRKKSFSTLSKSSKHSVVLQFLEPLSFRASRELEPTSFPSPQSNTVIFEKSEFNCTTKHHFLIRIKLLAKSNSRRMLYTKRLYDFSWRNFGDILYCTVV